MNNKFKIFLQQTFILIYLIILIIIISFAALIMFLVSVDCSYNTTNNRSTSIDSLNIIEKTLLNIDFSDWNKICDWNLIVINDENEISSNFKPKLKCCTGVEVDERIIPDLEEMLSDAASQNISIWVSSGYRSVENQNVIFKKKVSENMKKDDLSTDTQTIINQMVEKPGTSEHHTGLAIDLNGDQDDFCNTDAYNWLIENSFKYGFILRYKAEKQHITKRKYQPWHFRYVGKLHSKTIEEKNMCLEEYVSSIMFK
ncbi:MAG: hypothetical protein RUMPE_00279 [Eubacteriales bacterium SKADARSKE-1]|nr:hypothetical protein [Eubacteriales bacterium SKADARSKE-1]